MLMLMLMLMLILILILILMEECPSQTDVFSHEPGGAGARRALDGGDQVGFGRLASGKIAASRDGGTGRRSGLKIRRPSGLGGSIPPPGTNQNPRITSLDASGNSTMFPV